jgi:hypothetical protein
MIAILEMPDSPAELGDWLDRAIMGGNLPSIIDELSVVHGVADDEVSVEKAREWLGDSYDAVMDRGLCAISQSRLKHLLVHPNMLVAIQELVLLDGGVYWNNLIAEDRLAAAERQLPHGQRISRWWLFAFVPVALAASLALFVTYDFGRAPELLGPMGRRDVAVMRGGGVLHEFSPAEGDELWGWSRPDLLDGIDSPREIPPRLADTLGEWFDVSTAAESDVQALTLRANELWAGCEQVSSQPLDGLSPVSKEKIAAAISALQRKLEAVLKDLDGPLPEGRESAIVTAARKSIDSAVGEAAIELRNVR